MLNKLRYILSKRQYRELGEYDVDLEKLENMAKDGAIILDVRSPQEYEEGHIDGAILIPEYELKRRVSSELRDKEKIIVVYCKSGSRSKRAQNELKSLGYKNVYNLYNGIDNY